jgi:hypothetical protein
MVGSDAGARRTCAVLATLGAALAGAPACTPADSVVLVQVQGAVAVPIHQLAVEVKVGSQTRSLRVPEQATAPFFLPTNFSLQIPRGVTGSLRVAVTALDQAGGTIATGSSTFPELAVGLTDEMEVVLGPVAPGGGSPDAGALDGGAPDTTADEAPPLPVDIAHDAGADAAPDGPGAASPDLAADDTTEDGAFFDDGG